jgi:hypothetical protein
MMMLIHTTFETGIVDFYNLLVVEGRQRIRLACNEKINFNEKGNY